MNENANNERERPESAEQRTKTSVDPGLRSRQRVIGVGLKRLFDDIVDERVPEDFEALLAQFDKDVPGGER